ncbi:fibronectin type III domain-containing protein [Candidatus Saccharibacteria bacterium]|nr:fibronectin type III domain-containing protein [Candidatus Saccharibacteria bacterium]
MKIRKRIKASQITAILLAAVVGASALITMQPEATNASILNQKYRFIDTNYAIPSSNVTIVDPNGNDTTGDGSQLKPYKTLQKAYSSTVTGGTVVMNSGIYRQPHMFIDRTVTIQAAPHAEVWIKGTRVVTNWVQSGSVWIASGWAPNFCNGYFQGNTSLSCTTNPNPAVEGMAAYPSQVFFNEQPLTEVTSQAAVGPGQFYIDSAGQRVIVGSNPGGQTVEVSEHQRALSITATNVQLLGINFAQYSPQQGWQRTGQTLDVGPCQVYVANGNILIENMVMVQSAAYGLSTSGANVTVRNSQFIDNGANGMGSNRGDNLLVENNKFINNNSAGFNVTSCGDYCGVSDIKITHAENITFRGNFLSGTVGPGFWCDEGCIDTKVINNFASGVTGESIFYEVSSQAIIAGNIVEGSGNGGITVASSDHVQVYNNTLTRSKRPLRVYEDPRVASCNKYVIGTGCTAPENWSMSKGLTWSTTNLIVRNNIFSRAMAVSGENQLVRFQGVVKQDGSEVWAGDMLDAMDHNAYFRNSASDWHTVWYATSAPTIYFSLANFQTGTGFGQNSYDQVVATVSNPNFVNESLGLTDLQNSNYNLASGSPYLNYGAPLPTDVATAMGWPSGVPVNVGALNNQYMSLPLATTPMLQVMITSPIVGASLTGTPTLTVSLANDNPISKVEYFADGTKIGESTSSPFSFNWNTSTATNGDQALTAVVTDSLGNTATSSAVYVTVANAGTVPSAPQNLTLTPGNNQITASWTAPASDGGSPITGYVARISGNGGTTWLQTQNVAGTTYTFTGLDPSVTYTVEVWATNLNGASPSVLTTGRPQYVTLTMPGTNPSLSVTPGSTPSFSSTSLSTTVASSGTYQMTMSTNSASTALTNGSNTIPASSGTVASPITMAADTWGFRVDNSFGFGAGPTTASSNAAALPFTWAGVPPVTSPAIISLGTSATAGRTHTIWFGVGASAGKPSGSYTQTLVITVVGG